MTLEEVRKMIDCVDTQIKPLFLERMACAEHVAAAKAENGSDVFVPDRENEIILKRTGDVDVSVKREYEMFLRHLMSVCRRYQYGILTEMQEQVIAEALKQAGLDEHVSHEQITVSFTDHREKSSLNGKPGSPSWPGSLADGGGVPGGPAAAAWNCRGSNSDGGVRHPALSADADPPWESGGGS